MMGSANAAERAKWEVLWIKDRKIHRKDCGTDLTEGIRLYMMLKGKRSGVTLRCKNFGSPPPLRLQSRIVQYKVLERLDRPRIVRRNGKRYRKTHETVIKRGLYVPMKKKNRDGIWWCPYCRELRRFVKKKYIEVELTPGGRTTQIHEPGMYCPMCGVSHRDHSVRKWNPIAVKVFYEMEATHARAPARTAQSRRTARRRRRKRENGR
jgi:hypothetical protein